MKDWVSQGETSVIDKPEYHFVIEEFRRGADQMLFIHLRVYVWQKSVFKEIIRNWKLFRECVTCPVFAICGSTDTETWEHFVSFLGFQFLMNIICENGEQRRLFVHNKEENNNERAIKLQHSRLNE